jgi:hypothetical protein
MNNIVTTRFVECFERLRELNKVRSGRQFAMALDYLPQSFSEILKGRRDVTIELLRKAVEMYHINPHYVVRGEGGMFIGEDAHEASRVLTIICDNDDNEKILHVPVKAQAGYAGEMLETEFIEELPKYTLPDYNYKVGTHRSFDVAGDSMEPTLKEGDRVICSFIDHFQWESSVKNNHVYVIVTKGDVLVKRVQNNIRRHRHLMLISDNEFYPDIRINVNEIREVWVVKTKISEFSHLPPEKSSGMPGTDLHEIILEQSAQIRSLNETIEKLLNREIAIS